MSERHWNRQFTGDDSEIQIKNKIWRINSNSPYWREWIRYEESYSE